jgi:pyruvate-formate lyase-activating enzyme
MIRAYIQKLRRESDDMVRRAFYGVTTSRSVVAAMVEAQGLVPGEGNRMAMLGAVARYVARARRHFRRWLDGRDSRALLAATLLDGARLLDDGRIWHRDQPFRSYVDVSVQVKLVRLAIDAVVARDPTLLVDPMQLADLLLESDRDSRVALLVKGQLLLDLGCADEAIETVRHALRVQSVCITAQQMLFRAYELARAAGSTAPELAALDYDLSDKFCPIPFTHFSTGFRGSVFACTCPAWVPFPIGDVTAAESADAIWNSGAAQEIRRSILDGDFSYCSRTQCSFITARKLPRKSEVTTPKLRAFIDRRQTRIEARPEMVELNHDPTCNLACPSCRTEIVAAKADEIDVYAGAAEKVIVPLLRGVEGQTYITGGGEAFASKHFRSILRRLNRDEFPGLQVFLITNGQLMTPHRWSEFPRLPEMLSIISVSVDAARAETYEVLRRPGKWAPLMKNLEYLAEMRRAGRVRRLGLNFVVQKANFREMLDFVALADGFSADHIWFQRVVNYGAYDEAAFAAADVSAPAHPDHAELLAILRNPALARPVIQKDMLLSLTPESTDRFDFLY